VDGASVTILDRRRARHRRPRLRDAQVARGQRTVATSIHAKPGKNAVSARIEIEPGEAGSFTAHRATKASGA
jgi:hypothetical protein